ncbi:DNA-directed RNA polymerase subunit alpha [Candidatus Uhrbacteria bacterium RIFCSPHIGHO2_02_FULL_54_11]|nr:MAG: DNA-directed RNA polymerase subunit alpha [Candidatus Uhrbacteria bacterium RIFCSPHIGHO2_02_FULL_54_11]
MENILLPSKVSIEEGQYDREAHLIVEPCFYGYGTTVGNALRRVLLSSLVGAAVTSVKIKGFTHEFQAIPNVKEDVLQVILNLKQVRVRLHTDEPVKLELHVKGKKIVTAGDIQANADVEVVNADLELCTLTDDSASFDMELTVERGRGFSPTEERDTSGYDLGTIAIDALFSPIRNVSYRVEETRVGEITDYDKLILTIETDGTITPREAVEEATKILMNYFSIIVGQIGGAEPVKE